VLDGHEVTGFEQDAIGVATTVRNPETGKERTIRSAYLVGTDGAHSRVRELAGIEFDGRGVFSNSVTIYFKAPLAPLLAGTNFSVIYIGNPHLGGFFRLDKDQNSGFLVVKSGAILTGRGDEAVPGRTHEHPSESRGRPGRGRRICGPSRRAGGPRRSTCFVGRSCCSRELMRPAGRTPCCRRS
jgi:hypothetical protein